MSKQCPSEAIRCASEKATRRDRSKALGPWRRRVFRNSYTRQGRRHLLRGWSLKLQFQGRRRTFSLRGRTRTEAAREAQRLHQTILDKGWEAAIDLHRERQRAAPGLPPCVETAHLTKSQLAHWEQRLIQRRYHEARLNDAPEYSARIEHGGAFGYFPLGSNEPKQAARRATEIHRAIVTSGWPLVFERVAREITLAIFWSDNPVAVTYSTLYTLVEKAASASDMVPVGDRSRKRIALLEPDPTTLDCVQFWLHRQPGFQCPQAFRTGDELLNWLEGARPGVVLVNRASPDLGRVVKGVKSRLPEVPLFPYQIHEESDQIFISISGVSGGYILKRRPPLALFEPLHPAVRARALTANDAARLIRDYFQAFFVEPSATANRSSTEGLTQREQEILSHMSKGYLHKEIAHRLNLSIWTVHNHVKHIYEKLKVHNRTEAVLEYLQK